MKINDDIIQVIDYLVNAISNGKYFYYQVSYIPETKLDDKGFLNRLFVGGYADQAANAAEIKRLYDETGYMIDTHTGVASCVYHNYVKETGDTKKTVIASTASPYKFSRSVMEAIFGSEEGKGEFELIDEMEKASGVKIPQAIEEIRKAEIRHNRQCKPEEMEKTVSEILQ